MPRSGSTTAIRGSVAGSPGLRTKVALVATHITVVFNSVSSVVRDPVSTVIAIATKVVVCFNRLVVCQALEVGRDDALQLLTNGALSFLPDGVEERIVRDEGLCIYLRAGVVVDFDFLALSINNLEPRADIDDLSGIRFCCYMLDHIA